MAKVQFIGACGVVTGSSTLLSWGDTRVLVDHGMYQGNEETKKKNWDQLPIPADQISAVLVTHAHLDHTGLLPKLVRRGFSGPIYCSRASRGLVSLILQDSGRLQEEQARYARKKGYSRHTDPKPLYRSDDAKKTLRLLSPLPFGEDREILPGITVRLHRSGHLLGAASIEIRAKDSNGQRKTWLFSGDIGRYDVPILKDPEPPAVKPDVLVIESTYGDGFHPHSDPEARFREVIERVFARRGKVIIPAFALGRTQEVLYHLSELVNDNVLDPGQVYLDSPMAVKATDLYEQAKLEHDEELAALVEQELSPLDPDRFHRCNRPNESKALNKRKGPFVIVASSGMATGGRVVHHLKHCLADDRNAVVFTGYQASGTRGRALVNGASTVAIHGDLIPVRAEIQSLHGLSAHADQRELIRWCKSLAAVPERIFLNHGEDPARKALAAAFTEENWPCPTLPEPLQQVSW